MTIKTLLVSASNGAGRDTRLDLACDLAAAFHARLIGVGACALEPVPADPFWAGGMTGELLGLYRDMAENDVSEARRGFETVAAARAVETGWIGMIDHPAAVLNAAARAADLILVAAPNDSTPFRGPDPVEVITGAGRPVLVVPPAPLAPPLGRPAVVAWKDSRECRLAAAAALPLLKRATGTHVLAVCSEDQAEITAVQVADVAAWLARHGVKASSETLVRNEAETARRLLDRAVALDAGLIVAGAYGHFRLTEWILGGVTRSLLADSGLCLLMAR
jgi:nucleotide-binding universal stress UspA family protein